MVRRLIEQEERRLRQQQPRQRDAHLPSPRKVRAELVGILRLEPQALENRFDELLLLIPPQHLKILLSGREGVERLLRVITVLNDSGPQFELDASVLHEGHFRFGLLEDRPGRTAHGALSQVAHPHVAVHERLSRIHPHRPGNGAQQCALSGAVNPYDAPPLVRLDAPLNVLEEGGRATGDGHVGEAECSPLGVSDDGAVDFIRVGGRSGRFGESGGVERAAGCRACAPPESCGRY
mmetsp:Transcript_10645/g.31478  ORF Transcript_10645/g.31478 Transcript_10645/m.31478 type:complete len:236 (+) Transcript_10645:1156-1863(+)